MVAQCQHLLLTLENLKVYDSTGSKLLHPCQEYELKEVWEAEVEKEIS